MDVATKWKPIYLQDGGNRNGSEMEVPNTIQKQQSLKMWVTLNEKKEENRKKCKKQSQGRKKK